MGLTVLSNVWIKHGVTREVFLTKRFAIKTPKLTKGWKLFLHGLLANIQEKEFSEARWPELCPVVFAVWGGWLIAMPRARLLTDAEWKSFRFSTFTKKPDYLIPVENKRDSFGILNGRIVALDYGS